MYEGTKIGASVFVSFSFAVGVPGNILVMLVHKNIKEKTVTDWMIFYIAVCDVMSLVNVPSYVSQYQDYWSIYSYPNFLCKAHYFNLNSVSMASYICTACTAMERYFKVLLSKEIFSSSKAKYIWIPIFITAYAAGAPTLWVINNNDNNRCMYDMKVRYLATIEYGILLFTAVVASVVMTVCYIKIGLFLMRKIREMSSATFAKSYKSTVHTTKMLAIVTGVFLFSSNVPYIAGLMMSIKKPDTEPEMSLTVIFGITFFFNTFFNPILYLGMSPTFRQRVKSLFYGCCCSKYTPEEETSGSSSTDQQKSLNYI